MKRVVLLLLGLAVASAAAAIWYTRDRQPAVPPDTYREAVTAFHVSLAAMQTSQDVLARERLERLTAIVPQEPAGFANLGLLLLRQQQTDEAAKQLQQAARLAPDSAAIERLRALTESLRGNLEASLGHWRRALELEPSDPRAAYALAQELERRAGPGDEEEAQRVVADLAARTGNLAAQLEYARIAAKRGDRDALARALDAIDARAAGWPDDARARLAAVREAAAGDPVGASTPVIFLRNVLIPTPEFRNAHAAVTTPQGEVGQPLTAFLVLPNPAPQPAAPDDQLVFTVDAAPAVAAAGATWAGAVWLTGEEPPLLAAAGAQEMRLSSGASLPFPSGAAATAPSPDGVAAADLDSDFRTDLVLAGAGGLRLFRQDAQGAFADVTAASTLPPQTLAAPLHGVWPADIDTDGDLDLVAAPVDGAPLVLRNNGDGTFTVQTPFTGVTSVRGFAWGDLDGEGVPDAVLLDARGAVRVFRNLRGGAFREQPLPDGFPDVAAIAVSDVTASGTFDVVGVTDRSEIVRLTWSAGSGEWDTGTIGFVEAVDGLVPGAVRLLTGDVDNNGAADLIVAGASRSRVLLGEGGGAFRPLPAAVAIGAAGLADIDGSGRLALIGAAEDGARIGRSLGGRAYRWQAIRTRAATATGDQRVNSFGIGGEVEIRAGLHAQKQVIGAPVVHFGLGDAEGAEVARITWPNGVLQSEFDLAADTTILASQRLKGSCPWLFAWNGREMAFVTDFIWRSPLGLRINAQATADVLMTEEWVRIRADQLAPRDGAYDLRVTAELWETHFLDMLSLLVVDHPEDAEVFVDERFAVPPPPLGLVATSRVRELARVRDDRGRDVSDVVRVRDDRHLDFAGRGRYQGVTRHHHVELELPQDAPRTGPLWLIAQGWVHPTDSSINVALAQGSHPRPDSLSLQVADAKGRFRTVRTNLGFPAGKDKTILIDLEGVFPADGPRRLRLQTNLEVFWDRLGWAVGRPDVDLRVQRLQPSSADLRYRGYSVTSQKDPATPERPVYRLEGTAPRWRDLEGFHTRFGDVRALVQTVDDRYVIMNAGDELRLRFPEVPQPGPGLARSFVLVGDGWEKDGDYNTTASRTVLPLPTHESASYEPGTGRLEDDPVYQRHRPDFERYHTRYVVPRVGAALRALDPGR